MDTAPVPMRRKFSLFENNQQMKVIKESSNEDAGGA
jgi:hypothetical protein